MDCLWHPGTLYRQSRTCWLTFYGRGIRCTAFIDDVLFVARSKKEALHIRSVVLQPLNQLGRRMSKNRSLLEPEQVIAHQGGLYFGYQRFEGTVYVVNDRRCLSARSPNDETVKEKCPYSSTNNEVRKEMNPSFNCQTIGFRRMTKH